MEERVKAVSETFRLMKREIICLMNCQVTLFSTQDKCVRRLAGSREFNRHCQHGENQPVEVIGRYMDRAVELQNGFRRALH